MKSLSTKGEGKKVGRGQGGWPADRRQLKACLN